MVALSTKYDILILYSSSTYRWSGGKAYACGDRVRRRWASLNSLRSAKQEAQSVHAWVAHSSLTMVYKRAGSTPAERKAGQWFILALRNPNRLTRLQLGLTRRGY